MLLSSVWSVYISLYDLCINIMCNIMHHFLVSRRHYYLTALSNCTRWWITMCTPIGSFCMAAQLHKVEFNGKILAQHQWSLPLKHCITENRCQCEHTRRRCCLNTELNATFNVYPCFLSHLLQVIYTSFGGTSKGLHFNYLIVGLVLLTRGRDEEKAKCRCIEGHMLFCIAIKSLCLIISVHYA